MVGMMTINMHGTLMQVPCNDCRHAHYHRQPNRKQGHTISQRLLVSPFCPTQETRKALSLPTLVGVSAIASSPLLDVLAQLELAFVPLGGQANLLKS
jgi:hypothetical protein